MNDFVIGLALLALGCYVLFTDKVIFGNVMKTPGGPLVHPAVYARLLGGILTFLAALLVLKSFNWTRKAVIVPFHFIMTPHIFLTLAALILYTFVLPHAGFVVSTFVLNFFLTCVFLHRERTGEGKPQPGRKDIIRSLVHITVYSALLLIFIYFLFTKVLFVNLP